MRIVLLAALALGADAVQLAHAQTFDPNHPVCMHIFRWGGEDYDCSYASLAQCQFSAAGRGAMCVINPYRANAYAEPQPRSARRGQAY
ncbi:DUF3551 domain-containing protein [Bradyrhizobium lablabi]|uniref:DUF3551 domain-containing protein n=1 Tax=Bradyrhizobium lablabi TaxID=722472 RepID=UPI001BAB6917|nr:DUF3551 domain-containing protein [Bradyrhizobium lablabi]MBR0697518.1 DUF3551 domain-containing protein [Bradyrhizobium lablabi]